MSWAADKLLNYGDIGAGEGNRTLVCSLGSCRSTIELRPRLEATYSESSTPHKLGVIAFPRHGWRPSYGDCAIACAIDRDPTAPAPSTPASGAPVGTPSPKPVDLPYCGIVGAAAPSGSRRSMRERTTKPKPASAPARTIMRS